MFQAKVNTWFFLAFTNFPFIYHNIFIFYYIRVLAKHLLQDKFSFRGEKIYVRLMFSPDCQLKFEKSLSIYYVCITQLICSEFFGSSIYHISVINTLICNARASLHNIWKEKYRLSVLLLFFCPLFLITFTHGCVTACIDHL